MSEIAERARSSRQMWAAPGGSHDRVVGLARVLLPVGIGILTAFLVIAPLTMSSDISFVLAKDKVDVARERMRVSEALYRGEDSKGQPFALSAGSAVQASSREPIVRLNSLAARIALPEGPATLRADQGHYDMDTENVAIDGPLLFQAADGYRLATRDVVVDLTSRQLTSSGPVDGTMPLGRFSANRMTADLPGRIVTLDGRARLHIVQGASR
jgi:lipopolysaccharide export system protein LptC